MSNYSNSPKRCTTALIILVLTPLSLFVVSCVIGQAYEVLQDVEVPDERGSRIIQESKNLFELSDRCDPFPCLDHFQVMSIESLNEPLTLRHTGAAGMSVQPPTDKPRVTGVTIIESSILLHRHPESKEYTCRPGDYLVLITRRNMLYLPTDSIRLCYGLGSSSMQC